ncbi:MAG: HEAT repeat domain-containing protein [Cytophagales bacterium]|nr:HEAT repeat domain-containing protein [Cytophagales bacterium]
MKTYEEVRTILSDIEPSEDTYSSLDTDDIPHLRQLLQENEPWLASRAVFALSRLPTRDTDALLLQAARDQRSEVRVAAAVCSARLPTDVSDQVLDSLIDDQDLGVRKFAVQSITDASSDVLKQKLRRISSADGNAFIKSIATERLFNLR